MSETIEIELTPTNAKALEELEDVYGEIIVQNDLQRAVSQAIADGYRDLEVQRRNR